MGTLTYDNTMVHMEDRVLVHLEIVIIEKFAKGESFLMSWRDSAEAGDGRSSVWMHPLMLLSFKYDGSKVPAINPSWLATLSQLADSSRGLIVVAETGVVPALGRDPRRTKVRDTIIVAENMAVSTA